AGLELGAAQHIERLVDAGGVVVGALLAAAQDHVAVGVTAGDDDRRQPLFGDAEEAVRMGGGADAVDGDLEAALAAVGAVLEANRHGEARRELAVDLALGGARANGAPADR